MYMNLHPQMTGMDKEKVILTKKRKKNYPRIHFFLVIKKNQMGFIEFIYRFVLVFFSYSSLSSN